MKDDQTKAWNEVQLDARELLGLSQIAKVSAAEASDGPACIGRVLNKVGGESPPILEIPNAPARLLSKIGEVPLPPPAVEIQ
jgi:hypothetical protein